MRFIRTAAALTLLTVLGFAAFQVGPARAYQRLRDLDWLRTATPSEQRATAHQALAFLLGDPHDAFAVLEQHGDRSSIPFLQTALARQPNDQINTVAGALILSAAVQVSCVVAADGQPVVSDNPPEANPLALVGRRLSVQYVEPEGDDVRFDAEYRVRIEVLQVLFGRYPAKEMEFSSFVHVGQPAFEQDEFGLVYVSRYEGRFVQQKYLFQPLHRTHDGRLAGCGDPYGWMPDIHRHGVRAELIAFSPPVTFDVGKGAESQGFTSFRAPYFRVQDNIASCVMGNYPEDLFRVMAEGYLKARRVLGPTTEEI